MKDKKGLIKIAGAVLVLILSYIFIIRPLWINKINELDSQISESDKLLRSYAQRGDPLPSQETLDHYIKMQHAAINRYTSVARYMDPGSLELPEGTKEPGLYFREELYTIKKNLAQMALKAKTSLPENLGFSDTLPDAKEVPLLVRKLQVTNRVAEILLSEGVSDISLLKPLDVTKVAGEQAGLGYQVLEIQLVFRSNISSLVGILHRLAAASPVLVIRDIQAKEMSSTVIETHLIVSHVITEKGAG